MKEKRLAVTGIPEVELTVRHWNITSEAPVNQHEIHAHKECEIYLNLSGDVAFEVENRIYPISRGSVIITRPYEYHRCIYRSDERHEHFWLTFSSPGAEKFFDFFYSREKGEGNLILLGEEEVKELCSGLKELMEAEPDPLKCGIIFLQLIRILRAGRPWKYTDSMNKMPEDVAAALRFMEEHLTEDIDIKTLCSVCSVSVNTLERHFKEAVGTSPMAMLRKKRLLLSMEYLRDGDTVTEAALKSGFPDYSNYIQLFRRQFGVTPLKYKKSVGVDG